MHAKDTFCLVLLPVLLEVLGPQRHPGSISVGSHSNLLPYKVHTGYMEAVLPKVANGKGVGRARKPPKNSQWYQKKGDEREGLNDSCTLQ